MINFSKLSTSQEAMDNRLNEMSKQMEERNTTSTNQFEAFHEDQTAQSQRGSYPKNEAKTLITHQ